MSHFRKIVIIFISIAAFVLIFRYFSPNTPVVVVPSVASPHVAESSRSATITIGGAVVIADIADTLALREQGLSGRVSLAPQEGLLFVFDKPNQNFFWMKDMNFPIDIIWVAEDNTLIDITHDADPSSYPAAFTSRGPARYVLEVAAGTSRDGNFQLGEQVGIEGL